MATPLTTIILQPDKRSLHGGIVRELPTWPDRGVAVEWAPGAVRGFNEDDVRTFTLNSSMPTDLLHSTLAHETGHAHQGYIRPTTPSSASAGNALRLASLRRC